MKYRWGTAAFLVTLLLLPFSSAGSDGYLQRWNEFARRDGSRLIGWLEGEAKKIMGGSQRPADFRGPVPSYYGRVGIFVTLLAAGKVRGCFGAFHHRSHRFSETVRGYLKGALRSDPRYSPLGIEELGDCEIVVTIASPPAGIVSIETLDLERYGVLYRYSDGSSGVIVPAEVRTVDYLKRIAERKEVVSRSSFRAVTIRKKINRE